MKKYIGIILSALYALVIRLLCEDPIAIEIFDFNIYSISFLWLMPIALGLIPILFSQREILSSRSKQFYFPIISVLLFFVIALTHGIEDWLCILMLSMPFLLVAGMSGLVFGEIIRKRNPNQFYVLVFLPLLFSPIESHLLEDSVNEYHVSSKIIMNADKSLIWSYVNEVPEIKEEEYQKGIFNYIGVPRPVKSEINSINGKNIRKGYFTDDLQLHERIVVQRINEYVEFEIDLNQSQLRDQPTDQHILQSGNFRFDKIAYELEETDKGILVTLHCNYIIQSKMNTYANFWAQLIIKDFEERLLQAIKYKVEND